MANYKVGSFTSPTAISDTVTITLGFQVKMLFVWTNISQSYDSFSGEAHQTWGNGFAPGPSLQKFFNFASRFESLFTNQSSTSNTGTAHVAFLGTGVNYSSIVVQDVEVNAVSDTDIQLIWRTTNSTSYKYDYLAIGGAGVTVTQGTGTCPTSIGSQAIAHGLSATPALVMLRSNTSANANGHCASVGYCDGTRQGVTAWMEAGTTNGVTGANPSVTKMYQRTSKYIALQNPTTGALIGEAEHTSFDVTNFTINWTTAPAAGQSFEWLAISGITAEVGSFSQPVATSVQTVPLGIVPNVLLTQSFGQVADTVVKDNLRWSCGFTDGNNTNQKCQFLGDNTGITSFANRRAVKSHTDDGSVYSAHPTGTATGAIDAVGAIALLSDHFDVTWLTVDATARQWIFVAFGIPTPADSGSNGPNGILDAVTLSIRRLRRFPHSADEQQRIFYRCFQLDIEAGVGTVSGQGSDPVLALRCSNDGGFTWSEPRILGVGKLGEYRYRCRALQLGSARDRVFEIVQSDPVKSIWLAAYLDLEEGTN